ncbi:sulfurtransferase TusA family protein [Rhodothalassium salexigens]|uniref:sulfurtransferase TusA family protein n=1 Tax=Rhodothalassium salexigens TaxID=1086 RepID=UPI00140482DD|nr:sulfurtransferase TusA family protein [Rhodothalassium salexigens]MBB4212540.1 tRNA 2-thiouridine synthesizing protein A [Rhodothalassium salexigens DSM 2132]
MPQNINQHVHLLDATGLEGPSVIRQVRQALKAMIPGQRLEVWAERSIAVRDIPVFCANNNHRLVMAHQADEGLAVLIEKGRASADMGALAMGAASAAPARPDPVD